MTRTPARTASAADAAPTAMPWAALVLLATACFTAVATETLPVGLLPLMATDLGVSQSRIGLLVSVYAVAVVVASVPLNAWTARLARRPLLIVLVGVYGLSNLVLCLTGSYGVAAGARLLGGLSHALFFAVLFGYAVALAPRHRTATAIAVVGSGSGIAIAIGTPLGTLLAAGIGWRGTFAVVAGLSLVMVALIRWRLPVLPGSTVTGGTQLREVLGRPAFRWLELATVLMMVGVFVAYTFMTPTVITYGFAADTVGLPLLIFGVASVAARFAFGGLGDRHLRTAFVIDLAALVVVLLALSLLPRNPVVGTVLLVLWGLAFGPLSTYLQVAVIRAAEGHTETASAVHNSVFNVGIALGAFVGAQVVARASTVELGLVAAPVVLASVPIVALWLSGRRAAGTAR